MNTFNEVSLLKFLENKCRDAFNKTQLDQNYPIMLVKSTRKEFGDFQINGIMNIAKILKSNPRQLAIAVVEHLNLDNIASKIEIAGAGFINITLNDNFLIKFLTNFYVPIKLSLKQTVVIDYSSPNLAKEMHVGHLRSTIIGDCLVRVFEYLGYHVIRQNHVGDWGTQFGMLIAYMFEQVEYLDENFKITDLEIFYRNAKIRFDTDNSFQEKARKFVVILQNYQQYGEEGKRVYNYWQAFTQESLKHCEKIYDALNVELNIKDTAPESMYNKELPLIIQKLEDKNLIVMSDNAKCIFFNENELIGKENTPFIVQKNDGAYLYATTDLAAIDYRVHTLKANKIIYVVDMRQTFHFIQLFLVATKAKLVNDDTQLIHVAFGTMTDVNHKPFKTREGGVVKLADLISDAESKALDVIKSRNPDWLDSQQQELAKIIAIDAIKYADLSKNRLSDYVFNLDRMLAFEGNTALYLLYANSRINSLLKKAGINFDNEVVLDFEQVENIEHHILVHLACFYDVILFVSQDCSPHHLCQYLYDLSGLFMQFYEICPILQLSDEKLKLNRLKLISLIAKYLGIGLNLLGIQTIERM